MNDGSIVPKALDQVKEYLINLEKKYVLLAAVVQDITGIDEKSSVGEAIQALYEEVDEPIPEEIQDMLDKL